MKTKINWLLAAAALLCVVGWSGSAQKPGPSKATWEYATMRNPDDARINEFGAQGWELVSVTFGCASEFNCSSLAYFKRAR